MTELEVQRDFFAVTITATTPVDAPAERVWGVLADTASYPEWNPFVRRLDGDLAIGGRLRVVLQPGAGKPTTLRPTVVAFEAGRSFTWLGHVGLPGLLDGRHTFTVAPDAGARCTLVQHERLSGVLTPVVRRMLLADTPAAFVASNDALAARVASR